MKSSTRLPTKARPTAPIGRRVDPPHLPAPPPAPARSPGPLRVRTGLGLTALAAAGILWGGRQAALHLLDRAQRSWVEEAAQLTPADAAAFFDRLVALPDPPVEAVAVGLLSPEPELAAAADRAVRLLLKAWEQEPAERGSARLTRLAEALAARERDLATARGNLEWLVDRLLDWPHAALDADRERRLAACERILRNLPGATPVSPAALAPEQTPRPLDEWTPVTALARLPGWTEPPPFAAWPPAPRTAQEAPPAEDGSSEVDGSSEEVAPAAAGGADVPLPLRPQALAVDASAQPLANAPERLPAVSVAPARRATRVEGGDAPFPLAAPAEAHFRALHADPQDAAAARQRLAELDVSPVLLALGLAATDPDPRVRQRCAEQAARVAGAAAEPWLRWFASDPDAEVRGTALSLLATSGDPARRSEVLRRAARDPDPRIRRLAAQLDAGR